MNLRVGPVRIELTNSHVHAYLMSLIHTYLNPKIQISKTMLKKGGSITVYRKLNPVTKKYITKAG